MNNWSIESILTFHKANFNKPVDLMICTVTKPLFWQFFTTLV